MLAAGKRRGEEAHGDDLPRHASTAKIIARLLPLGVVLSRCIMGLYGKDGRRVWSPS